MKRVALFTMLALAGCSPSATGQTASSQGPKVVGFAMQGDLYAVLSQYPNGTQMVCRYSVNPFANEGAAQLQGCARLP